MPGTGHAPRRRDGRPFFVTRLPCRPRTLPVCFAHGGMIFGSVQSTRPVPAQAARRPDRTSTGIAARAAASARGTILKACKAVFAASAAAGPSAAHAPLCNNLPRHCAAGRWSGLAWQQLFSCIIRKYCPSDGFSQTGRLPRQAAEASSAPGFYQVFFDL